MTNAQDAINLAIDEVTRARSSVRRGRSKQVTKPEEIGYLRAVAYSWANAHRSVIASHPARPDLSLLNSHYEDILAATGKHAARQTYSRALKDTKAALVSLRSELLVAPRATPRMPNSEEPPNFAPLAVDAQMRAILVCRWQECQRCMRADAHLAATVMMGGLLEALFVARANRMSDKSPLFMSPATPRDGQTKKPLQLKEWTLRPYIDVGYELRWITKSGKDVAAVLRDYRNYVHPEKQRSHGVTLGEFDSAVFWEITKSLARQLLVVS